MLKRRIGSGNERQTNHFPSFETVCTKAKKDTSDWQRGIEEVPRQFSNASWKSASPRSRVLALKWGGEGGRGEAAAAARYYCYIGGRLQSPPSSVSSSSPFFSFPSPFCNLSILPRFLSPSFSFSLDSLFLFRPLRSHAHDGGAREIRRQGNFPTNFQKAWIFFLLRNMNTIYIFFLQVV